MQPRPLPPHRTAHCRSAEREARGCLAAPCARAAHPWGHFREADAHLVTHVLISGAPSPGRRAARGCSARQARSRRALRAPRTRRPGCRAAERERRQESGRANEWAGHSDLEPRAAAVQRAAAPRARLATGMHPRKASKKERGQGAARERPRRHADPGLPPLEKPGRRAQAPRTTQRARGRVYLPPLSARSIHAHPLCTEHSPLRLFW